MADQSPQAGEWVLVLRAMLTGWQVEWLRDHAAPQTDAWMLARAAALAAAPAAPPSDSAARIEALEKALAECVNADDLAAVVAARIRARSLLSTKEGE